MDDDETALAKALCLAHCSGDCPYGVGKCAEAKLWAFLVPDARMAMKLLADRGWTAPSPPTPE